MPFPPRAEASLRAPASSNRRSDLLLGGLLSLAAHAAILAMAGVTLRPRTPGSGVPPPPLEVVAIDERTWLEQLEGASPATSTAPREASSLRDPSKLPEWPELAVERPSPPAESAAPPLERPSIERRPLRDPRTPERLEATPLLELEPSAESTPAAEGTIAREIAPSVLEPGSPLVLYRPPLRYPPKMLQRGIEGVVRLGVEVGPGGKVLRAAILESSGQRTLDRAALQNVLGWRLDPLALIRERAVHRYATSVRFEIPGSKR